MNHESRDLFFELADLTQSERDKVLAIRQITPEVRAEVESLLQFDSHPGNLLTSAVSSAAEEMLGGEPADLRYGAYRLIRMLGRGGMGSVFLAERADGEIRQQVAIKLLLHRSRSPELVERFRRERQILAQLSHPSIARLLDAGHTGDGQPYLVMEYVDGNSIDVCPGCLDRNVQLTVFIKVCEAVAHAHRRLVIHRDLKPSNILVDAFGQPKLLDFGIAKILDESADPTVTAERFLTPGYASPEQMKGEVQGTPSDIYSLGAVLHRLLNGSVINSQTRDSCDRNPKRHLPSDLCFIVSKAMREEPDERYPSAEALADDIRAFLDGRPVQARSGSRWYVTRKFLRRHWLPAAAGVVAVTGLAAGQLLANRERAVAERRFNQARQLASQLGEVEKDIRFLPGSTKAREHIVTMSLGYLERLGAEAGDDRDLTLEIGETYLQVARAQGVLAASSLGQVDHAEKSLSQADRYLDEVLASEPNNRKALRASMEVAHDIMVMGEAVFRRTHSTEQGLKYSHRLESRADGLIQAGELTVPEREAIVRSFSNASVTHTNLNLADEAMRYAKRAVEVARELPPSRPRAGSLGMLANSLRHQGNLDQALLAAREARSMLEALVTPDDTRTIFDFSSWLIREGQVLGDEGISLKRPAEAVAPLQKAFDMMEDVAAKDPNDARSRLRLAFTGTILGYMLRQTHPGRGGQMYDLAIRRTAEVKENDDARRYEVFLLAGSTYPLRSLGRIAESQRRLDTAFQMLRQIKAYPADRVELGSEVDAALRAQADHFAATGHLDRSLSAYQKLAGQVQGSSEAIKTNLSLADAYSTIHKSLAVLSDRAGHRVEASQAQTALLELWNHWDRRLPNNSFIQRQLAATREILR